MQTKFYPTYLMIKQHSVTGLKYFCKTTRKNPIKYLGSGSYWKNHIKKHGKEFVITTWVQLFDSKEELTNYAIKFSIENDIVNSKEWANLILENGLDGAVTGSKNPKQSKKFKENNPMKPGTTNSGSFKPGHTHTHSSETKQKISISKLKENNPMYGNKDASLHLNNNRATCEICGITTNIGNIKRWHSNCKDKHQ